MGWSISKCLCDTKAINGWADMTWQGAMVDMQSYKGSHLMMIELCNI